MVFHVYPNLTYWHLLVSLFEDRYERDSLPAAEQILQRLRYDCFDRLHTAQSTPFRYLQWQKILHRRKVCGSQYGLFKLNHREVLAPFFYTSLGISYEVQNNLLTSVSGKDDFTLETASEIFMRSHILPSKFHGFHLYRRGETSAAQAYDINSRKIDGVACCKNIRRNILHYSCRRLSSHEPLYGKTGELAYLRL